MSYLGFILFILVGPSVAILGLIRPSLFHRGGWAPGRVKLLGIGFGVMVVGFVTFGLTVEPSGKTAQQSASKSEPALQPAASTPARTAPVQSQPTTATPAKQPAAEPARTVAAEPPPSTPKVPQISEAVLPAYCAYEQASLEVTRESQRRFTDMAQADAWAEAEVRKLSTKLAEEAGAAFPNILAHAIRNRWKLRCNAVHAGLLMIDDKASAAADRSDAETARKALEAYYVFRLNSENHPLFDRSRYDAIRCGWENVGDVRVAGCQPVSWRSAGDWGVYVVGRKSDGGLLIAPLNGTAQTHVKGMAHLLDESRKEILVAAYVGKAVDIPAALKALD